MLDVVCSGRKTQDRAVARRGSSSSLGLGTFRKFILGVVIDECHTIELLFPPTKLARQKKMIER